MQKETKNNLYTIHRQLRDMLANSLVVIGLGAWLRRKMYGTYTHKLDGAWDRTTEEMMAYFHRFGYLIFCASSAFARGELRSKGGGKKSIHFQWQHAKH